MLTLHEGSTERTSSFLPYEFDKTKYYTAVN